MYFWIKAIRESAFCAQHYSYMVHYHTVLIVGMSVLRPLCFALFLVAKCLVLLRLVEITAPGSKSTICLRITCIVSVVASNLVTLVAAGLYGWTDGYYLRAYGSAQSVIKVLDEELCIDSLGHFNSSSTTCRNTLFSDVFPVLNELKSRQSDSTSYATLHYGSQARYLVSLLLFTPCDVSSRAQVVSLLLVVSWFVWGVIYSQMYATVCPSPIILNALCMWLRRLIKASRQSEHGDDLARENPSMYYLAKSLGTMGTHYNLNLKRQRQVMISSLFIGFTFSIRAILTAVLAIGNSSSNSYFPAKPNFNTTDDEVSFMTHLSGISRCLLITRPQVGKQLCDRSNQPPVSIAFFWLFFSPWVSPWPCFHVIVHSPILCFYQSHHADTKCCFFGLRACCCSVCSVGLRPI